MATIKFQSNYIIVKADAAVVKLDLDFANAGALNNNQATPTALSGSSAKATVYFKGNNTPPKTFKVTQEVTFPDAGHVTIMGGGANSNVLEAFDGIGNKGVWSLVGS